MLLIETYGKLDRAFKELRVKHPLLEEAHIVADMDASSALRSTMGAMNQLLKAGLLPETLSMAAISQFRARYIFGSEVMFRLSMKGSDANYKRLLAKLHRLGIARVDVDGVVLYRRDELEDALKGSLYRRHPID